MEQWFKVTLWMFVLIGSLQAMPLFEIHPFKGYETEVTCGTNVTFITPKDVEESCNTAAMGYFIKGLKQANQTCTDPEEETLQLLDIITEVYPENPDGPQPVTEPTSSPQTQCMSLKDGQTYAEFRQALISILGRLNTRHAQG